MKPTTKSFLALCTLILAGLACNAPAPKLGGPQPPANAPQPSEEGLESFKQKWRDLNLATPDGPFGITFTEEELTSALAEALTQAETDNGEPLPIEDVQIVLNDGAIYAYGRATLDLVQANGLIVATPNIGPDGHVHVTITTIEFGPLELEPALLDDLVASIEHSINEPIQASQLRITLSTIHIADGLMTISGTIVAP